MSKTNAFEISLLTLLFNNTNIANVGDATGVRGSTAAGNFYVSLHTADPGETGDQTTNEAAYGGYARAPVARTSAGWTISSPSGVGTVSPTAQVNFATGTAGPGTGTHFGIGTALT